MYPGAGWGFYLASKSAFEWWLRTVALEARRDGVTVSQHYLGSVRTKMSAPKSWLHQFPSQSADEAARGVARSIANRTRYASWLPMFLVSTFTGLFRVPLDLGMEWQIRRKPLSGNEYSTGRARPQEDYIMGDPYEFERRRRTNGRGGESGTVPSRTRS